MNAAASKHGGARPGAGRPRKYPAPIPNPVPPVMEFCAAINKPYGLILRHQPGITGRKTTSGALANYEQAWVYVADCGDGWTKVGMTTDCEKRMHQLKAKLIHSVKVKPGFAKTIETQTLRYLGVGKGPWSREFIKCKPSKAVDALNKAIADLGMVRSVVVESRP